MLELIQTLKNKINKGYFLMFYKRSFKLFGKHSTISFPFQVNGAKFVSIGEKVHIHTNAWLLALPNHTSTPNLIIHDNTYIGRLVHIVCVNNITICKDVLISDKVYISDNLHEYKDINIPIKSQNIINKGDVVIGEHTWLGENVCVIGSSVGKHCVVGANSVVVTDIPDYSVAVGSPAKVIKRFNKSTANWEKMDN